MSEHAATLKGRPTTVVGRGFSLALALLLAACTQQRPEGSADRRLHLPEGRVPRRSAREPMSRFPRIIAATLLGLLFASPVPAAQRYDPRLTFRTLRTAHFDIYFHQREEALAGRLARIVEDVSQQLERDLGRPSARVRVILVDQGDLANGWATPVPYDLIEIEAVSPRADSTIGNTDDWLRLVFSHEYTHVVHLDRSRGWIGGLRHAFGRLPPLFPNLFLPEWEIEGLATYEESALTAQGRVPAGDFRMLLDRAAADGGLLALDQASGGLVDWPSGNAVYLYGAYFHQYLAARYGPEKLRALADETSHRIPYIGTPAFKKVFGRSLGDLWSDFEADARAHAAVEPTNRTRLTTQGFNVSAPRYGPDGALYYSVANPHGFPALMRLDPGQDAPREVATRYLGNRIAVAGDLLVFDQLEVVRNVALQADLYAVARGGGRTRRLTREARAADPDVSPDGRTIVCTVQSAGSRALATMALPTDRRPSRPIPLVAEENTDWSSPRWSPDGRAIAAERRRLGGPSEIVLVDVETRAVRTLVSSSPARNVAPSWTGDGTSLLFASDRDGGPFAIYKVDVASGAIARLRGTGSGAEFPALSPDGHTLTFVGYTAGGHDLFSIPYDGALWEAAQDARMPDVASPASAVQPAATRAYRPWQTLAPTFWTPVLASDAGEFVGGAATGGSDALGRHTYFGSIGWSPSRARPDWSLAYVYDRWWPTIFADLSDNTDPWRAGEVRTREANAGVVLPWSRVRWNQAAFLAWHTSTDAFDCADCAPPVDTDVRRRAARLGWSLGNAKAFGYSISAEQGARVTATSEFTRRSLGADGDATAVTVDARAYVGVWPRHGVIAARAAFASAWGDETVRRLFSAGGNGPALGGFAFGSDAIGLLRGFDDGSVVGPRAFVANLDYRFPLARIQHGAGTLPVFLRTIHGAIFADVGNAWDTDFRATDLRRSFGTELSFDIIAGYALPFTLTTGAAWRDDAGHSDLVGFARIGRAF